MEPIETALTTSIQLKCGLLTIKLVRSEALTLAEALTNKIREISRMEICDKTEYDTETPIISWLSDAFVARNLGWMARYSRMCYELYQSNTLTDLSKEDVEALYELPLTGTGNLHNILNKYRFSVSPSGIDDIAEGHVMAKSVRTTLES
jgi:hypothetical protein